MIGLFCQGGEFLLRSFTYRGDDTAASDAGPAPSGARPSSRRGPRVSCSRAWTCASAARALITLMDGLQIQWLLDRDHVDMADDLRRYLQPLLTVDL